jgi:hypothetical protein
MKHGVTEKGCNQTLDTLRSLIKVFEYSDLTDASREV